MSVVIAIKQGDRVIMGCDSQITKGTSRSSITSPNNFKIWKVKDTDNCLMGSVGLYRDAMVMRVTGGLIGEATAIKNEVDYKYVVCKVMPRIIHDLIEFGFYKEDALFTGIESKFVFAFKNKLYEIARDCSVTEIDDFVAIGSGESEAVGSLLSTAGEDPRSRIVKAIKAAAAHDLYIDYPIIISDTERTEYETIFEDD